MPRYRLLSIAICAMFASPLAAQRANANARNAAEDSTTDQQQEEGRPGLQFGVATSALGYGGGASERELGGVIRWVPVRWFSLSATPTGAHVDAPRTSTRAALSRSGLMDLPIEASASHNLGGRYQPTLSASLGLSLPLGDSASGMGEGKVGYSSSVGLGVAPTPGTWAHLGAGRSLSGFASALGAGSVWSDVSAGRSLTDRLEVSGGLSTDFGPVDPAVGHTSSINAGVAYSVSGPTTLNLNLGRGLSGMAPDWSVGIGFGTAFPYLNHLGSGGIPQHGLGTGNGGSIPPGLGLGHRKG